MIVFKFHSLWHLEGMQISNLLAKNQWTYTCLHGNSEFVIAAPMSKIQNHESHGDSWQSRTLGHGSAGIVGILGSFLPDPHLTPDLSPIPELDFTPEPHPSHSLLTPTFSFLSFVITFSFILTLKCTPSLSLHLELGEEAFKQAQRQCDGAFCLI